MTDPDPDPEPLIRLSGISRTFDATETVGIKDISLTVDRGEFVAIVGPSGAGKSTLLNVLGLLDRPDSGEYAFNGRDVNLLDERERNRLRSTELGFVFQSSFLLADENALRNAALGLRIQGIPMRRRSALALQALRKVGVGQRWATPGRLLSGGERQRVAIARAIATRPSVILADEPTGNLDTVNGTRVIEHLRELNRQGVTIIVITHDREIAAAADRQVSVIDGRIQDEAGGAHLRPVQPGRPPRARATITSRIADDFADAVTSLSQRLLRTLLLVVAFTLGISGLIAATGLSESASAQVAERLTQAALDEVRITPPGGPELFSPESTTLNGWVERLQAIPHVESVGYVATVPAAAAHLRRLSNSEPAPVADYVLAAASPSYLRMMGARLHEGAQLTLLSNSAITNSAWAGRAASDGLELASPGAGSTLWGVGRQLELAGTLEAGGRAPQLDRTIVVTPDVIAGLSQVDITLVIRTEPGFPAVVADAAPLALDAANPGNFRVETVADLRALRFGVSNDLGTFVGALAVILLALATVSASTTMYLSVQSRAHEIALRRAIGASRIEVARLFLAEGLLIGVVGGAVGAAAGTIAAFFAAGTQGWTPVLPPALAPAAILLGLATGLISAVVPAWAASRQEPAAAIRQ